MSSTVIGLDIGATGIRAAEITKGPRGTHLRRFAFAPLAEGTLSAGRVLDADALASALRELWSRGKFSSKQVALGLGDDSVVVRQLDLDWMPEDHFRQALRYQVADVVPLPVDEANLDHILLDDLEVVDAESGETRRVARILLVAAPRDLVDGMVRAVESAGLRVVRADLAPLALIRASSGGSTTRATGGTGGTEAIVDIGAETVTTTVHRDGRPIFVRFLPGLGGASLTRALQNEFDWTFDEAERTKRASGLLASARHPDDPAPLEHPAQHLLTDLAVELVDEVRATLAFSLDTYDEPSAQLDRVVLTGGGAHLGGLAHLTETVLGVPVVQLDQPTGLRGRGRSPIAQDAAGVSVLATGLALGGVA